jgi:hypothetical protein
MKSIEYIGTLASLIAYLLITSGSGQLLMLGLGLGTIGSSFLLVIAHHNNLNGLRGLQMFFIIANIFALIRIFVG